MLVRLGRDRESKNLKYEINTYAYRNLSHYIKLTFILFLVMYCLFLSSMSSFILLTPEFPSPRE
jgi:hypothetical protein